MPLEIDVYIPLRFNSNKEIPKEILGDMKSKIIKYCGGITDLKFKSEGEWRMGGVVFRDEIVVWRAFADESSETQEFLKALKQELKEKLQQSEILISVKAAKFI